VARVVVERLTESTSRTVPALIMSDMSLKRLLLIAFVLFFIFFIVQSPAEAAHVVKVTGETLGEWMGELARSLAKFVKSLV
jgi:hypothetical protein